MADDLFSKKCDTCGQQPAMLFFRSVHQESQQIKEEGLCPKCALHKFSNNEGNILEYKDNKEILNTLNHMRHILSDIVGYIHKSSSEKSKNEKCSICNTSLTDLQLSKQVGCSQCYQDFKSILIKEFLSNIFGYKHLGQIPTRYRQHHLKNMELEKLQLKLQGLLREEKYEEAIKVNRRIQKLKTSQIHY